MLCSVTSTSLPFFRSCCVWGGVQVRHAGPQLCVSRHLHPGHAPRAHLPRTVSHFSLAFLILLSVKLTFLHMFMSDEVKRSVYGTGTERWITLCKTEGTGSQERFKWGKKIKQTVTKWISLDVFFVKQCEKLSAGKWVILFHSMQTDHF